MKTIVKSIIALLFVGNSSFAFHDVEVANEENQQTIKKMGEDAIRLNALTDQLSIDLRKAEEYGDELRNTLNKHDMTHLANKKPGLIEKRMQDATDKLWDDLESITGDSTTD